MTPTKSRPSLPTLAFLAFCTAGAGQAAAQGATPAAGDDWTALDGDWSRTALFKADIVAAREKADPAEQGSTTHFNLPPDFYFPEDARRDKALDKPREGALFGIDISHYTGKDLDHTLLRLQAVRFVYVKATQGVRFKDGDFGASWARLHALPPAQAVSAGAYHFLTAGDPGKEQARRFVDFLALHGGLKPDDMPPCLDLEWDRTPTERDRWTRVSAEDAVRNAVEWLEYVEARTGRRPVVYTAKSWLDERGIKSELLGRLTRYPIWIADYSRSRKAIEKPSVPPGATQVLWQFASDARLSNGYGGGLDANIFYGSEEDFVKAFLVR